MYWQTRDSTRNIMSLQLHGKFPKSCRILYKMQNFLTTFAIGFMCYYLNHPFITNCINGYAPTYKTISRPNILSQKRIIRALSCASRRDQTLPLFVNGISSDCVTPCFLLRRSFTKLCINRTTLKTSVSKKSTLSLISQSIRVCIFASTSQHGPNYFKIPNC